jgi:hypothetical protein
MKRYLFLLLAFLVCTSGIASASGTPGIAIYKPSWGGDSHGGIIRLAIRVTHCEDQKCHYWIEISHWRDGGSRKEGEATGSPSSFHAIFGDVGRDSLKPGETYRYKGVVEYSGGRVESHSESFRG